MAYTVEKRYSRVPTSLPSANYEEYSATRSCAWAACPEAGRLGGASAMLFRPNLARKPEVELELVILYKMVYFLLFMSQNDTFK